MRFIACLLHVIFLHSSSFFHLAVSCYHFVELFVVVHRFCIASLTCPFLFNLRHSSSSFHRGFEMYKFLRVFDVICL